MTSTKQLTNNQPDNYTWQNKEDVLKRLGWVEDKLMSGRYISPYTKITYTVEQASRIEGLC